MTDSDSDPSAARSQATEPDLTWFDHATTIGVGITIGFLVFLGFQPSDPEPPTRLISLDNQTTFELKKQPRTHAVALQLLSRPDVDEATADGCVRRLAVLSNASPYAICCEQIASLPDNEPHAKLVMWKQLLSNHSTKQQLKTLDPERISSASAQKVVLAAWIVKDPSTLDLTLDEFSQTAAQQNVLLASISMVSNRELARRCLGGIDVRIIQPIVAVPEAADSRTVIQILDTVSQMNVRSVDRSKVYCKLALTGICRSECFRKLSHQPISSIPKRDSGRLAASLIDYLALQSRRPSAYDEQIWQFSNTLVKAFSGTRRERYLERLAELRSSLNNAQAVANAGDSIE